MNAGSSTSSYEHADLKNIGLRLKEVRKQLAYSIAKIGDLTGVSPGYISDIERGQTFPASKYLYALALNFSVDMNYILRGVGRPFFEANRDDKALLEQFGKMAEDVEELITFMARDKSFMYNMLKRLNDYKLDKK